MAETLYTVMEVANLLNVSKVTVYSRVKKLDKVLSPFVKVVNNITYIDQQGVEILKGESEPLQLNNDPLHQVNNDNLQEGEKLFISDDTRVLSALNESLTGELKTLQQQLKEKHEYIKMFQNQIDMKDKQIDELSRALSQSQKINENSQVLLRESQQKMLLQKNFWSRIFKN